MRKGTLGVWLLLAAAGTARAEQAAPSPEPRSSFGQRWVATRLVVGARFTYYWLEDSRRAGENGYDNGNSDANFLGSLWGLDAQQHYFPNPYLEYRIVSGVGLGITYDQLRAKTLDWANEDQTATAGDGDLEIRGVGVYILGRYRNRSRFEPYGTVGFAWYRSHFDVSPGWLTPGRRFEVENTDGWFVTAGCKMILIKHLGVDVMFRHSHVGDVVARAYFRPNRFRGGTFPMRYDALAIGALYAF